MEDMEVISVKWAKDGGGTVCAFLLCSNGKWYLTEELEIIGGCRVRERT